LQYEKEPSNIWKFYYVIFYVVAVLAMFTKEMTITLPLMVLMYEQCFLKTKKSINPSAEFPRFKPGDECEAASGGNPRANKSVMGDIVTKKKGAPDFSPGGSTKKYLIVAILLFMPLTMLLTKSVDFFHMKRISEDGSYGAPLGYILTQFRVMVTYSRLLFMPLNQNLDYDYPISKSLLEFPTLASFIFLIILLVMAFRMFGKYRLLSFSIFWFFLTLLPESSIIPIKDVIFEHRLYLPMVGYSIFLVSVIYYLFGNKNIILMITISALIVNWYAVSTYNRNFDWQNKLVLLDDIIHKSPRKARPYLNRGFVYLELREHKMAISDFDRALMLYYEKLRIRQNYFEVYKEMLKTENGYYNIYNFLAMKFSEIGITAASIPLIKKAIEINPSCIQGYINLSAAYGDSKRYKEAIMIGKKALALEPNSGQVYYNLAVAFYFDNQHDLSFKYLEIATKLGFKPDPGFLRIIEQERKEQVGH